MGVAARRHQGWMALIMAEQCLPLKNGGIIIIYMVNTIIGIIRSAYNIYYNCTY